MPTDLKPVRRGLTIFQDGRLVHKTGDLLEIQSQIRDRWPQVEVYFDEVDKRWILMQKMDDGEEKLIFGTEALDQRVIERLEKADPESRGYVDPLKFMEDYDEKREKELDHDLAEATGEGHERLLHALRKDGLTDHPNIFGPSRGSRRS